MHGGGGLDAYRSGMLIRRVCRAELGQSDLLEEGRTEGPSPHVPNRRFHCLPSVFGIGQSEGTVIPRKTSSGGRGVLDC